MILLFAPLIMVVCFAFIVMEEVLYFLLGFTSKTAVPVDESAGSGGAASLGVVVCLVMFSSLNIM